MDCRSTASSTVGVCSTARRKRNHVVNGMRRAACSGRSPRSRAINPKPPLSSSRSVARRSCSRLFSGEFSPQRTHSSRSNSTPAAAADCGSRASLASTSAQHSPRRVAAASAASSKVVRPEEAGPQISVRQLTRQTSGKSIHRGDAAGDHFRRRPHRQSRGWSNAGEPRIFRRKDGSRKNRSSRSSLRWPTLDEKLRTGRLRAIFGAFFNKNKRAALGRRSGNHCGRHRFLEKISGNAGAGTPGGIFAFYSPIRIVRLATEIVKQVQREMSTQLVGSDLADASLRAAEWR